MQMTIDLNTLLVILFGIFALGIVVYAFALYKQIVRHMCQTLSFLHSFKSRLEIIHEHVEIVAIHVQSIKEANRLL